ncbi:MAG: hypothetical protein ACI4UC_00385 [Alloprevotella sp.]
MPLPHPFQIIGFLRRRRSATIGGGRRSGDGGEGMPCLHEAPLREQSAPLRKQSARRTNETARCANETAPRGKAVRGAVKWGWGCGLRTARD